VLNCERDAIEELKEAGSAKNCVRGRNDSLRDIHLQHSVTFRAAGMRTYAFVIAGQRVRENTVLRQQQIWIASSLRSSQ
jgi:hypothetical protein